jgi:hypothetical protein
VIAELMSLDYNVVMNERKSKGQTPVQEFFISRLSKQVEQRVRYTGLVEGEDWRTKLISRAIYSSYRDLVDLGLGDEARKILTQGREVTRGTLIKP